jgi:hypothetical protein
MRNEVVGGNSCFATMVNFGVTFKNKFERSDWGFMLKVGATIVIKQIDAFSLHL